MTPKQQATVESSIRALYRSAKLTKAPKIVWAANPQEMLELALAEFVNTPGFAKHTVMRHFINQLWRGIRPAYGKAQQAARTEKQLAAEMKIVRFQNALRTAESMAYQQGIAALADRIATQTEKELDELGLVVSNQQRGTFRRSERTNLSRTPGMELPRVAHTSRIVDKCHTRLTPTTAYVCPPPTIGPHLDAQGRLHSETGPAVKYADGWVMWALQGITVSEETVKHPETLTPARIRQERNVERRRIMIERFGLKNYLQKDGGQVIDTDIDPSGRPRHLWRSRNGRAIEPMVAVEVVNSTPEPDGHYKSYVLRVPPQMTTAQQAVAWTFNMRPDLYRVAVET